MRRRSTCCSATRIPRVYTSMADLWGASVAQIVQHWWRRLTRRSPCARRRSRQRQTKPNSRATLRCCRPNTPPRKFLHNAVTSTESLLTSKRPCLLSPLNFGQPTANHTRGQGRSMILPCRRASFLSPSTASSPFSCSTSSLFCRVDCLQTTLEAVQQLGRCSGRGKQNLSSVLVCSIIRQDCPAAFARAGDLRFNRNRVVGCAFGVSGGLPSSSSARHCISTNYIRLRAPNLDGLFHFLQQGGLRRIPATTLG